MESEDNELYEHHRFVADPGQRPLRVDRFLINKIINTSRTKIQDAAAGGYIAVNDIPVKGNYKVKAGDVVSISMPYPPREITIIPEDIPLDIIYEDDALMVVNKPAGMVVHPGHGNYTGTLVNALAYHLRENPMFSGDDTRPGLVHRIDKDTTGLLVIAKTEHAKLFLAKQFFEKTTQRKYEAVIWGTPKEESGTVIGHIGRSKNDRKQMDVFPDGEFGKEAITHYRVIRNIGYVTHVECQLETGRTHQIRAHMKYLGHPLFNDERYGGNRILKGTTFSKYKQFVENCFKTCPRQALHAKTLGFIHPETKEMMSFKAEIPEDMQALIDRWETYTVNRI